MFILHPQSERCSTNPTRDARYSLIGEESDPGLLPRLLEALFQQESVLRVHGGGLILMSEVPLYAPRVAWSCWSHSPSRSEGLKPVVSTRYSLIGEESDPGLLPRLLEALFQQESVLVGQTQVTIKFMEVPLCMAIVYT